MVVCCSINIVRVFIIVDTVTESDVTIVSCSCSVLKSRSIKTNSRCRAFNKNQLSLSSVPPPTNVSTICRESRETQTPKPASTAARVDIGITRYFTLKCYVSSVHGNVHRQRFFLATGLVCNMDMLEHGGAVYSCLQHTLVQLPPPPSTNVSPPADFPC